MKKLLPIMATGLLIVQLAVPVSMIVRHERVLRKGRVFRFKVDLRDPLDLMAGRYQRLNIDSSFYSTNPPPGGSASEKSSWEYFPAYVLVTNDARGFAVLADFSTSKPSGDAAGFKAEIIRAINYGEKEGNNRFGYAVRRLPFDRYYLEEETAWLAETRLGQERNLSNCWVRVRILDGRATLE